MKLAKLISICMVLLTLMSAVIEPVSAQGRTQVRVQNRGYHAGIHHPSVRVNRSRRVNRSWRASNRRNYNQHRRNNRRHDNHRHW